MGNSLKSKHSRKSHTFKHTKVNFRDYANPPGSPFDTKNPSGKPIAPIVTRLEDTTLKSKEDVKIRSRILETPIHNLTIKPVEEGAKKDLGKYGYVYHGPEQYHYNSHSFAYDNEKHIPLWVLERLTEENFEKTDYLFPKLRQDEELDAIRPDLDIIKGYESSSLDYKDEKNRTWVPGQMAAIANHANNKNSVNSCMLISNFVPMNNIFKDLLWTFLEMYTRDIIIKHRCTTVHVVSGPVFIEEREDGFRYMNYETLGPNHIAVPTHLFKIIIANNEDRSKNAMACVVLPNAYFLLPPTLNKYQVNMKKLEDFTGLDFKSYKGIEKSYKQLFDIYNFDIPAYKKELGVKVTKYDDTTDTPIKLEPAKRF